MTKRAGGLWMAVMLAASAHAGEVVLTMRERSGHDRVDEPVRVGVPLATGTAASVDKMTLFDGDGTPIACQFRPVCRWPGDRSIKWVHLDYVTSIKAGATRRLKLSLDAARSPKPQAPVEAKKEGDRVTVTTGPLVVGLRGRGFNLFDTVSLNGKTLVQGGDGGICLQTDAGEFRSALDAHGKIEVESRGPICAVVRCEGELKNKEGRKAFDYCVRFYFYAGTSRVRVAFTYVSRVGNVVDRQEMRDLTVEIPTNAPAGATALLGTETAPQSATLKPSERLIVYQDTSDHYQVTRTSTSGARPVASETLVEGKGKTTKPLTTGWGGLLWPGGGVAAGWRWFWQTYPSRIELAGDGRIRLGLYPKEGRTPLLVYMGQARTHYFTFAFGPDEPQQLNDVFAGAQRPLRAFPSRRYLCRDSAAFGKTAESDPKLYGDMWPILRHYDAVLRQYMDTHLQRIDGAKYTPKRSSKQFYIEGYGYRPWGDAVLWLYPDAPYPWNVSWSGNYYDFSFTCLLQYMRTGDLDFLDQFELHTMHEADVFTVNHHPNKTLIGACRYCPPRNHVGIESAGKTQEPYVSLEFNHHKAQSTFALWYLLGDERMRDVALLKLSNAFSNHAADNGWKQIRGPGAQLATLYMGYELTHDRKYLQRMRGIVKRARDRLREHGPDSFAHKAGKFMYGIGMEGILYEYELTGDPESLSLVRALADHLIDWMSKRGQTRLHPNTTFAMAMLYHKTGDPKYKQVCLRTLEGVAARDWGEVKAVGQSFRNAPRAFCYLTVPAG